MKYHYDPEGLRLPVKLDASSNGEYEPIPLDPVHHHANYLAHETATGNAKHLGLDRRSFLVSACGVAGSLLGMNTAYAQQGARGSYFDIDKNAALDLVAARSAVDGDEFIFDVQGHFVNPTGAWTKRLPPGARPLRMPKTQGCGPSKGTGDIDRQNGQNERTKRVRVDIFDKL